MAGLAVLSRFFRSASSCFFSRSSAGEGSGEVNKRREGEGGEDSERGYNCRLKEERWGCQIVEVRYSRECLTDSTQENRVRKWGDNTGQQPSLQAAEATM